ncbi:DMT family transporter [Thalassospira marina]|uniref:EamA family transporter n=1 Tax=Thalassospira marina TaxID=2048283 RepID=A0A2N3KXL0_9PROT|nr:DMT family transporter [Thalassospira marina]PKR55247.1 EamA family transporter [Thalassospira marina]
MSKASRRQTTAQPQISPSEQGIDGLSWLMLIVLSVLWGGSFFFTEIALRELPPFNLVLARVALAATILWLIIGLRRISLPHMPSVWLGFLVMGILNNMIPFSLIVWSQTYIASGLAAILNATTPLFTLIIAHIATDSDKLTLRKVIGVVTGFAGVIIVTGNPALDALAGLTTSNNGSAISLATIAPFAVLAAAVSYGCAGVFGRRFKSVPPIVTAAGQTTGSSIMLAPLALMVDQPWHLPMPGMPTWLAVLGIASISTAAAYILYFKLLNRAGASNLLLVTFLIPVSAILLGVGFLGETLEITDIAGMLVIGLGLAIIDGRPVKWLRGKANSQTA